MKSGTLWHSDRETSINKLSALNICLCTVCTVFLFFLYWQCCCLWLKPCVFTALGCKSIQWELTSTPRGVYAFICPPVRIKWNNTQVPFVKYVPAYCTYINLSGRCSKRATCFPPDTDIGSSLCLGMNAEIQWMQYELSVYIFMFTQLVLQLHFLSL